jgi:hypothetical protein
MQAMSKKLTFHPIPDASWGFQPLEALFECWDKDGETRLGVLYKTYLNEPTQTPGTPIWVYAIDNQGGWAATSKLSVDDLKEKVLKLRHPKITSKK